MSTIKPINYADIVNSLAAYHFGWSEDELATYIKEYQSKYYGNVNDARFEISDNEGNVYYAIFRTPAEDEWFVKKPKDYLLFKDQNRILLNIGGKLYRYLIKEKEVLNNSCYDGIICNAYGKLNSPYFHSMSSVMHEIMIIVDKEGIAALNWDGVIWKLKFEWAASGYLELTELNDNDIIAKYYDPSDSLSPYRLTFPNRFL
jgi:hypothetical protein